MKPRHFILFIFIHLSFLFLNSYPQVIVGNRVLKTEPHPSFEYKIIVKLYDIKSRGLVEQWTFINRAEEITPANFNQLLKEGKIIPDGKHLLFHPNLKVMLEENFSSGFKTGKIIGYYESGEVKFKGNQNLALNGKLTHYYKNGNLKKEENFKGGILSGKTISYFPNGNIKSKAEFQNLLLNGKYTSYHENDLVKRKATFEMGKAVHEKCFDESHEKIACKEFVVAPRFTEEKYNFKTELRKLDLHFHSGQTDTSYLEINLKVEPSGTVSLEGLNFGRKEELSPYLKQWLTELPRLKPATIDGNPIPCYLQLGVPVTGNKMLFESEPDSYTTTFRDFGTQENITTFHQEYRNLANEQVFIIVDNMPQFPGGEKALRNFISLNIRYPELAQKSRVQGKIYVTFVIDSKGRPGNVKISKSVHPLLDAEAIRVIKEMPDWKPGSQKGKPVNVSYTVPINFELTTSTQKSVPRYYRGTIISQ
ncbi:TonB family protein [Maribellus comscasis]|uniref:TonB family protein n=1 Tax=Maribellus comscasis TaxID=2681766 RepID=A0A6I6K1M7_9BACT|nr:energy transducer TonB [Maribellus comscasis]QGY46332.1 TonB family protein [Maribellus comscasis]